VFFFCVKKKFQKQHRFSSFIKTFYTFFLILLTQISTSNLNVFIAKTSLNGLGQFARHRHSIHASHMIVNPLPSCYPTIAWIHESDQAIKIRACTFEDFVTVAFETQKFVAIFAAFIVKLIKSLEQIKK